MPVTAASVTPSTPSNEKPLRAGWRALLGCIAALACAFVSSPAAANVPRALLGRPIAAVEVRGEARGLLDEDELHLHVGDPLDRPHLRASAVALLATGEWADVEYDAVDEANGVRVIVTLVPRIVLARLDVVGNASLSDDSILDILGLTEGSEVTEASLDLALGELKAALAQRGYVDANVELALRDTDQPSRKVLIVRIDEGLPVRITAVRAVDRRGVETILPDDADLRGSLGLGPSDTLDRGRLGEGVRRLETHLRSIGFYAVRVGTPSIEGSVITLPVQLGHRYRVMIRGEEPLTHTDVESVLQLENESLTDAAMTDVAARIGELYRRHGFRDATAEVHRTLDPEERLEDGSLDPTHGVLAITIRPGPRLRVVGISFPGATQFRPEQLRDEIRSYLEEDLPASQPFEPVDSDVIDRIGLSGRSSVARRSIPEQLVDVPSSVWFEPTYTDALDHLTELYRAEGYLDAVVGPAELIELEDHLAAVTIPVYEGPRTLVYDVRVRGNQTVSTHDVLEATRLSRGEPFSYIALEEARRRVLDLYQDRGHLFARVEPVAHRSGDRQRAEVVLDVVERFPVHVGRIRVEGLDATSEDLVRGVLRFRQGDLYRPTQIRESEDSLLRLGVFSSVSITPVDPDLAERTKDVVVTVAERLPQELALSGGAGTGEGARGSFEYGYRNLFGYAVALSLRVQLAFQFFFQDRELEQAIQALNLLDRVERRITVGLAMPHVPGLRDVRAGLDLAHVRDNFRDFGLDKNGAVLTLTWQPERRFQGSLSTELEQNNVTLFGDIQDLQEYLSRPDVVNDQRTQRLLRVPQGVSALTSVRGVFAVDLRDSAFTPTSGFYASAALEWAHTIYTQRESDYSHFLKLTVTANGYVPIAPGVVLALQARGGRVFHLEPGSRTYPNRAYFLGGVDTLRGFLQDQVIPQDQVDLLDRERAAGRDLSAAAIVRTGDFFYLARAELRFPIVGVLHGGVFVDAGNVWADAQNWNPSLERLFRVSAGAGLRLETPVGPVAADYGVNLTRRQDLDEPFGSFHFSIGLF